MKMSVMPSKLELEVSENGTAVMFKVRNWQTNEQGYAVLGMSNISPHHVSSKISSDVFYTLQQFYPNGRNASKSEMRNGRGSEMLTQIMDYLKMRQIPVLYCHTKSESMQNFLESKTTYAELEEASGDYLLFNIN